MRGRRKDDGYFYCNGMRQSGQEKKSLEPSYPPPGKEHVCISLRFIQTVYDAMSHNRGEMPTITAISLMKWMGRTDISLQ